MKIVAIGEVLWDILPGAEHMGGAPFNFAWHARNLGHDVLLRYPKSRVKPVGHFGRERRYQNL